MSALTSRSSGLRTTDLAVWTGRAQLSGLTVLTDGTNAATVTIYDNTTNSGLVLAKLIVAGADRTQYQDFGSRPVVGEIGLFADVSGTGAEYIVYHG